MAVDKVLIIAGGIHMLIGLFSGFIPQQNKVVKSAAVQTHLVGTLQATLLLVLGAIWPHLNLDEKMDLLGKLCAIIGLYGNLFGILTTSLTGGGRALFSFSSRFWEKQIRYQSMSPKMKYFVDYLVIFQLNLSTLVIVLCLVVIVGALDEYDQTVAFYILLVISILFILMSIIMPIQVIKDYNAKQKTEATEEEQGILS